jgi:flagellar motor switch protein FliN
MSDIDVMNGLASEPMEADFAELTAGESMDGEVSINMLLDLSLPVSVELGRTNMLVQEILRLGRGSVIQLERLAGEPIDIYVGNRRFAEGEVVVLGEQFGVRITRIISQLSGLEGE